MSNSYLSDLFREDEEPDKPSNQLSYIFEEEPVSLDVFVRDQQFLNAPPLSDIQYDLIRHIERVYLADTFALMAEEFDPYWSVPIPQTNLIVAQWGKGGGKDYTVRVASLRVIYLLLCLRSPQEYFSMPPTETIHLLNVASSAPQAFRAFFQPMTRVVKLGWFADKADPKQNAITYNKNIEAVSGHSDAEGQEGLNLIMGVADEIDAFKSKEELVSARGNAARDSARGAEYILEMLRTSASTRFPEVYKNVTISYPRYIGSTIQKLTDKGQADMESKGSESRWYVSGPFATWEVNPRIKGPEAFQDDYDEDPAMAKAKYECKPARAVDSYFKNTEAIRMGMTLENPITIDYETQQVKSQITNETVEVWEPIYHFASDFRPIEGAVYAIHVDLAITGDRAGVSMSHVARYVTDELLSAGEEGETVTREVTKPVVVTDFVIAYEASKRTVPMRDIQVSWARKLIFSLIALGYPIGAVTYDGFQSVDSLQILNRHGIPTDLVSTDRDEGLWKTFKDVSYGNRWQGPASVLALEEFESLGRFGKKVDHPAGGSKDLIDAIVCSVAMAITLGGEEDPGGMIALASGGEIVVSFNDDFGLEGYEDDFIESFSWD